MNVAETASWEMANLENLYSLEFKREIHILFRYVMVYKYRLQLSVL